MQLISILAVFSVIFVSCCAYWIAPYENELVGSDNALDKIQSIKRAQIKLPCMSWGMPCLPDSDYSFAQCCNNKLICACNVWKTSCRCRSSLFG